MAKTRTVHLPLVDAVRSVDVPVPGGRGALGAILPAARAIGAAAMAHAVERERAEGRAVSCKAGCSACCRQLIPVSVIEARALAAVVARMPPARREAIRRRFANLVDRLEREGLVPARGQGPRTALVATTSGGDGSARWANVNARYYALRLDCPFLEAGRCVVYDDRPFVCREYLVTSPAALCDTLDPGVVPVPRPVYLTRALADVAEQLDGAAPSTIALPVLFEWLEHAAGPAGADHEASEALDALVESLAWYEEDAATSGAP
jgi:Fe-S-cluster containining protein